MDIPWAYYAGTQGKGYRNGLASAHLVAEALLGSQTHLQEAVIFLWHLQLRCSTGPCFDSAVGQHTKKDVVIVLEQAETSSLSLGIFIYA